MADDEVLLQILPENVWADIGDKVAKRRNGNFDSETFQVMSNSSMFFRNILYSKRSLALFQPALKIVVSWMQVSAEKKISANAKPSKSDEDLDNELQTTGREILSSILLNCRGVCKAWNFAVDKIIHDFTNYKVMGEGWTERFRGLEKGGLYFVVEISSLKRFMGHFEKTHNSQALVDRSPFVGKRAFVVFCSFGILDRGKDLRYPGEVLKVFKMYGRHLQSLRLHVVDNFASVEECYSKVRQLLSSTPNLKELDIKWDSVPARSQEEWEAVEVDKEENQLPHFPHLVQLDAILPVALFNQLIGKNKHVARLSVLEI